MKSVRSRRKKAKDHRHTVRMALRNAIPLASTDEQHTARDTIAMVMTSGMAIHPDSARDLFRAANLPLPDYLKPQPAPSTEDALALRAVAQELFSALPVHVSAAYYEGVRTAYGGRA